MFSPISITDVFTDIDEFYQVFSSLETARISDVKIRKKDSLRYY
ncbi:hypothetical protein BTN49_1270 [Candidatus Enterovibrio escicola]|uniref:Uncharacterized protein n=1 Tax=Candidatus Enterovibrio escicola TaxID=1927127 RepID=A0A2A5T541_9GAMM|nr:hypothetical protein BTN49_1270 [Candidatus Enterovibrio escacola]